MTAAAFDTRPCPRCGGATSHLYCQVRRFAVGDRVRHRVSGRTGLVAPKPAAIRREMTAWVKWDDGRPPAASRAFPGWLERIDN
jgi:hypothetical protein